MKMFGDLVVVVEALDKVDFAVAIEVAQPGNLVAAGDVDDLIHYFDSERLEQAGGDAFPNELFEVSIDAGDDPHVAVPSANCGTFAVAKEIEAAKAHPVVPGICRVGRGREFIDGERTFFASELAPRGEWWIPTRRSTLGERREVRCGDDSSASRPA
jgi:hypothetical protein